MRTSANDPTYGFTAVVPSDIELSRRPTRRGLLMSMWRCDDCGARVWIDECNAHRSADNAGELAAEQRNGLA